MLRRLLGDLVGLRTGKVRQSFFPYHFSIFNREKANRRYLDYEIIVLFKQAICIMARRERKRKGQEQHQGLAQEDPPVFSSICSTTRPNSATSSFAMGYVCSGAG